MRIRIFDVTHGFCSLLTANNGNTMLFDCGHNEITGFRPSNYLVANGYRRIDHLVISNFDRDHVSDLPNVVAKIPVTRFFRNQNVSAEAMADIKQAAGSIGSAVQFAINMHEEYVHPVANPPAFPDIEFVTFSNSYPRFQDTNNLSLVSFIHCNGMGIVFPGDMEVEGWRELLKNPYFRENLGRVSIFVASHHGRDSGYCDEVFNHCRPEVVIISDKEMIHESQEHCYNQHTRGLIWDGGPQRRHVLTTRRDGMITIDKEVGHGYHITAG
jgi:beta-lactamase superfamily II metal-dependent hydrolase